MSDKAGYAAVDMRVGLTNYNIPALFNFADDAEVFILGSQVVAASGSNVTVKVPDYTGLDYTMAFLFFDPDSSNDLTVKINGGSDSRALKPGHLVTDLLTGATVSNADNSNSNTLQVFGVINKSP
jgi:hypothetical protein